MPNTYFAAAAAKLYEVFRQAELPCLFQAGQFF